MRWLLADVGCLECGNATYHLGVFPDRDAVIAHVATLDARASVIFRTTADTASTDPDFDPRWGGQGVFVAFEVA